MTGDSAPPTGLARAGAVGLVGVALVVSLLLAVPFAAVTLARPAADQLRGGVNR